MKKLTLFLTLFSTATVGGFILGRHNSINSSNPKTARTYLALYGKWQRLDDTHGKITLRAGDQIFSYSTGDSAVSIHYLPPSEIARHPMPKIEMDKDAEQLVGLAITPPAGAGIAGTLVDAKEVQGVVDLKNPEIILLGALTAGAGALGYYWGHKSQPDYDNPIFQRTLKDPGLWASYENDLRKSSDQYASALKAKLAPSPVISAPPAQRIRDSQRWPTNRTLSSFALPSTSRLGHAELPSKTTVAAPFVQAPSFKPGSLELLLKTHPEIMNQTPRTRSSQGHLQPSN